MTCCLGLRWPGSLDSSACCPRRGLSGQANVPATLRDMPSPLSPGRAMSAPASKAGEGGAPGSGFLALLGSGMQGKDATVGEERLALDRSLGAMEVAYSVWLGLHIPAPGARGEGVAHCPFHHASHRRFPFGDCRKPRRNVSSPSL